MNHQFSGAARPRVFGVNLFDDGELSHELFFRGVTPSDDAALRAFFDGTIPVTARLNVVFRYVHYREYGSIREAVAIGFFSGNPGGLARILEELFGYYAGAKMDAEVFPCESLGYLCHTPEGGLRLFGWAADHHPRQVKRSEIEFVSGRPMERARGKFRLYAGRRLVAEFDRARLQEEMAPFRDILAPANIMAAKEAVRPGVIASVDGDPRLIEKTGATSREHAIEVIVAEKAGDLLFEQCRAAGLVQAQD